MRNSFGLSLCTLLLGVLAGGCDSAGDGAQQPGASSRGARKPLSAEGQRLAASMVSAVSAGEGASAVDVKFELDRRPEVGKPFNISLLLVPNVSLERLYARFQAEEGLDLITGEQTEQVARPVAGSGIAHTLTVLPKRDGIFTILAVVLTDSTSESVSRNYSIPVIAGSGLPEWSPKRTALSTANASSSQNPASH